ncbi:MAG: hypothetical protein SXQ77_06830, partial [Halobacteria archaeon]|nr:hypothetical protein [Halobacteria archaeon]
LVGLVFGSFLSAVAHITLGWHTAQVGYAPLLLLVGVVGATLVAEAVHRLELPVYALVVVDAVGVIVGGVGFYVLLPAYAERLNTGISRIITPRNIAETRSLVSADFTAGMFGALLVVALPVLVWVAWITYRDNDSRWLLVTVYTSYFLALAVPQRRFTGQLSLLVAVLSGIGFVYLVSKVDVGRPLAMLGDGSSGSDTSIRDVELDSKTAVYVVILFLLVSSLSYPYVQGRIGDLVMGDEVYDAAKWMEGYSEENDLKNEYVFSYWNKNRMFNYFVNGDSRFYGYARSNYVTFLRSDSPEKWFSRLEGRAGFVVLRRDIVVGEASPNTVYSILDRWGSYGDGASGSGHFRGVYSDNNGSVRIYTPVPGAVLNGTTSGEMVEASTNVTIPGASFEYERRVPTQNGRYEVRVAYPGEYEVGNTTVNVTETDVRSGNQILVK